MGRRCDRRELTWLAPRAGAWFEAPAPQSLITLCPVTASRGKAIPCATARGRPHKTVDKTRDAPPLEPRSAEMTPHNPPARGGQRDKEQCNVLQPVKLYKCLLLTCLTIGQWVEEQHGAWGARVGPCTLLPGPPASNAPRESGGTRALRVTKSHRICERDHRPA